MRLVMTWDTFNRPDVTLLHAATDCNRLQQTATDCIVTTWVTSKRLFNVSQYPGATYCNTLQHTAYTLQHTAHTLQHTANNIYTYLCIPPYIYICTLPTYIYRYTYHIYIDIRTTWVRQTLPTRHACDCNNQDPFTQKRPNTSKKDL